MCPACSLCKTYSFGASAFDQDIRDWDTGSVGSANYASMFSGASAMIARFGATGTTPVASFGNAAGSYTPTAAFFNQGDVSTLDGITSVTVSPTFATSTQNYTATAKAGALNLSIDLSRPTGAAAVTLSVNGGTANAVTVGAINPVTGIATLATTTIAKGTNVFTITVTSPDGTASTTYTVTVNSALVSLSPASTSVTEATTTIAFILTQDFPLETTTTVAYSIGGTASAGVDYSTPATGTVDIAKGATSSVLNVALINDAVAEGAETIVVTLTEIRQGNALLSATLYGDNNSE